MSENKALYKALLKYQEEGQTVSKDAVNPFHKNKYATLTHIVKEVIPRLNHHGLLLTQHPMTVEGDGCGVVVTVQTSLIHVESGESISCSPACKTDGSAQQTGSTITYLRRYGFSLIGLVTDDDDDGNTASKPAEKGKTAEVDKVEGAELSATEKKENGMRRKIVDICKQVSGGDDKQAGGVLYDLTHWVEGDVVKREGTREKAGLMTVKGKALAKVYALAKESEEAWKASSGKVESADDDGSTWNEETGEYEWK